MNSSALFTYQKNTGGRMSRTDEAVEAITSMIMDNGWGGGYKLPSQRSLAETLEFSRPTVREALVAMETLGSVVIQPGKGVFVSGGHSATPVVKPPSLERMVERSGLSGHGSQMYQFRYAIEPAIASLVALNATEAQIADMTVVVEAMVRAIEKEDFVGFFKLDFTFHSQMIEAANNRFFIEAMAPFLGLFFESQKIPQTEDSGVKETVDEHEMIMKCIAERKSVEARKAMEEHVRGVARRAGVRLLV
ncbi:FadR/GntR family transcriptional regulator [Maridesulfovibrio zosterae]|uniref:FadR/GntR family transcriptional regulator n=1 Tax=Maridesulfovibrio zosterae TaxID=82171 RepID=UPI000480269F|nr:FadR/GntR family transcriptional regulator [Maridesulfovibrio zosterae]